MSPAAWLLAALLAAPLPPTNPRNLRSPELEAAVQRLRPFDERFVHHPVIEMPIEDAIETFHQLWRIGLTGERAARGDKALAAEFHTVAAKARVATIAALTAEPFFRVARRSTLPVMSPADEKKTGQMVATVVARGEEVQRAISRILTRFPLWTDDAAWGYRPPPTHEPPPRFSR